MRSLPPLPGRRRAHEVHGTADVPLLHIVVTCAPGRRCTESRRHRLLPAPRRRAAGCRHPAVVDAVPLGSAAGAAGEGRLGCPRHRRPLHRVRTRHARCARRPGQRVDHPQRAVVLVVPELHRGVARARALQQERGDAGSPSPAARSWADGAGAARSRLVAEPRDHAQPHRRRSGRSGGPRRPRCRPADRRSVQPVVPRPDLPRPVPAGHLRRDRR